MLDAPDRSPSSEARPDVSASGEIVPHILVINSSPDFLELMRELFSDEQYRVTTALVSHETVGQIGHQHPDLLIVDLAVREPCGMTLLADLHAEPATRAIPVIVMSTSNTLLDQAEAERGRLAGDCYLRKPIDLDRLLATASELIGRAATPPDG